MPRDRLEPDPRRRRCLLALALAGSAPAWAPGAAGEGARSRGVTRVDVCAHGARGDGLHDDTGALQAAIDALPGSGGTVVVPAGRYLIDPRRSVRLRSHVHLSMTADTRLVALPNAAPRAYVLSLHGVEDVEISGGRILGERDRHRGDHGEWGHGIMVRGCTGVTLRDLFISRCWGDGVSIGGISGARPQPSRDVLLAGVICRGNRRQGLTIGRSRQVRVRRCEFTGTGGVLPGCGIDIEPDPGDYAQDILIEDCLARGNHGAGIQIYDRAREVTIRRCRINGNRGDGIHLRNAQDCVISDNDIDDNGLRGVAIRAASRGVHLSQNRFSGNARDSLRRAGREHGWMHVDVAKSASAVRVDRSNRLGR